jgi:hypothetical protein
LRIACATRPTTSSGLSETLIAAAKAAITAKPIPPMTAACSSPELIGMPRMIVGTTTSGSASSTPKVKMLAVASPDATRVRSIPASTSIGYCTAVPDAAPPGTMRLNAFEARCAAITGRHRRVRRQIRCSSQIEAKLAASSTTIGASHQGWRSISRGHEEKTATRLGKTK